MSEVLSVGGEVMSDGVVADLGKTAAEALLSMPEAQFLAPVGRDDTTYTVPTGDA